MHEFFSVTHTCFVSLELPFVWGTHISRVALPRHMVGRTAPARVGCAAARHPRRRAPGCVRWVGRPVGVARPWAGFSWLAAGACQAPPLPCGGGAAARCATIQLTQGTAMIVRCGNKHLVLFFSFPLPLLVYMYVRQQENERPTVLNVPSHSAAQRRADLPVF